MLPALAGRALEIVHLRSEPGLSRARNVALARIEADVVAFPDDDCTYPPGLLERVARQLGEDPALDGLSGRSVGRDGSASASWKQDAAVLTDDNLWNRVNSAALFLRRPVVERVGALRRAARARVGRAVVVGRGDRLRHPRGANRRSNRLRPVAHGHPRRPDARRGQRTEAQVPRRRERRLHPPQAWLLVARAAPNARAPARRGAALAAPPRTPDERSSTWPTLRGRPGRLPDELGEELGVTIEPGLEREPLDRARPGGC